MGDIRPHDLGCPGIASHGDDRVVYPLDRLDNDVGLAGQSSHKRGQDLKQLPLREDVPRPPLFLRNRLRQGRKRLLRQNLQPGQVPFQLRRRLARHTNKPKARQPDRTKPSPDLVEGLGQRKTRFLYLPKGTRQLIADLRPGIRDGHCKLREAGVLDPRLRTLADQVKDQGGFSNVSNQAMCYRLLDLKLVEDAKEAAGRLF